MSADDRHTARPVTLAFVLSGGDVLLKRHAPDSDRFPGCWNGLGGHVEPEEDVRAAARREVREESGLDVADLVLIVLNWGPCPSPPEICPGDLNDDGAVDVADLVEVILNWS